MPGLYIHIPFCKSRCTYCGFYSTTSLELRRQYVDAVCREMVIRGQRSKVEGQRSEVRGEQIETVYLGGGTPSQLTIDQLHQLFTYINKVYGLDLTRGQSPCEVTMEMNPDDVTALYAEELFRLGVNRVSMGAQTFDDRRLHFLHRRHSAAQVRKAVGILRTVGFRNISIDLMYGFPEETLEDFARDIDEVLALDVEHISAYCLMIEEGTPLYEQMVKGRSSEVEGQRLEVNEELERQMYEMLIDRLTAAGYEHYEISNFARPGRRSRHNSSYWHDVPYIGLGAAAHSYDLKSRSWNVADIRQYMAAIDSGVLPCEQEIIDDTTHYNDRITVALRTSYGLDLNTLPDRFRCYCLKEAEPFLKEGLLRLEAPQGERNAARLVLTRKGLFVSDMVMSALIYV